MPLYEAVFGKLNDAAICTSGARWRHFCGFVR